MSKSQYSREWDEDLYNFVRIYETMSKMCAVTEDKIRFSSLPILLTCDSFSYYMTTMQDYTD